MDMKMWAYAVGAGVIGAVLGATFKSESSGGLANLLNPSVLLSSFEYQLKARPINYAINVALGAGAFYYLATQTPIMRFVASLVVSDIAGMVNPIKM